MKLGFPAPVDCEGKGDGEAEDVPERNGKKLRCVGLVELNSFEACHGDGGGDSEDGDCDS